MCDYGDCNERRYFTPGKHLCCFECHGWKLGVMICADIRYTILSRKLVLGDNNNNNDNDSGNFHNANDNKSTINTTTTTASLLSVFDTCQVLLQPACFSRDISFYSWKSFKETRAIENSAYFLGVNYAGSYYGESSVTPPWVSFAESK